MAEKLSKKLIEKCVGVYHEKAGELAVMIGKINDMKGSFEYLMEETGDNGDPYFDSAQAIEKLGILLASVVTYEHEYEEDANAGSSKKDN